MAFEIIMPQFGLTMEEGTVTRWAVKEGDSVKKGDVLLEVTTDKLTNEVLSEYEGTVLKIVAQEGVDYPVKAVLAHIGEKGERVDAVAQSSDAAEQKAPDAAQSIPASVSAAGIRVKASPLARRTAKELGLDYTRITGTGPNGRIVHRDVIEYSQQPESESDSLKKASPLARKIAEDIGLDLRKVDAAGRVLASDILNYLEKTREAQPVNLQREEIKPMDGMRRTIAKNMLSSHMTSPTVSFNLSVDMSAMKQYRKQLKNNDVKVSYTDLMVKFVAKALTEFPLLNCSVDGNNIIYKNYVNMGVAVALENGLIVPNVTDADKKSLTQISAEVKELAELARSGKLPAEKMKGGTFTITNLGMFGIESFTPIINQPEVAILGVTTMEDRVVVRDGEMVIRPMMNLSLTADHRVVDGSVAAQFMQRIKVLLENPALMLA